MTITRIVQTCAACPSQWEGYLSDGRPIYIRYRHGILRAHVVDTTKDLTFEEPPIVDEQLNDDGLGEMDYAELRPLLAQHGIDTPDAMEENVRWHKGIIPALHPGNVDPDPDRG